MEKFLKLNNRIVVERIASDECFFLIDGLKKATFIPQDEDLYKLINKLTTSGIKKENINSIID